MSATTPRWRELLPPDAVVYSTREEEKAGWGDGPWRGEPDKVSWTDPATGRPCLIHRSPLGALCGYVAVDPGHPLHGVGYGDDAMPDLTVHGGLTYSDRCQDVPDESRGICHVPAPGAPHNVWWFGFDCAHAFDLVPQMEALYAQTGSPLGGTGSYCHVEYVVGQVQALAVQLAGRP